MVMRWTVNRHLMFVKPFYVASCQIDIKHLKKTTYFFWPYVFTIVYLAFY